MKFVYNKKIDKKCKEDIDACKLIFNEEKKTGVFPVNAEIIRKFESIWTPEVEEIFSKKIFQKFT